MPHLTLRTVLASLCLLAACASHAESVVVPSGATFALGSGQANLACANLSITGTFNGGTGTLDQAGNVGILPGGQLTGGSADLSVAGNWSNQGTFTPGTSLVAFTDACAGLPTTISGTSTFYDLSLNSTTGKPFVIASTQTVTNSLTTTGGTNGSPVQITSGSPAGRLVTTGATVNTPFANFAAGILAAISPSDPAAIPALSSTTLLALILLMGFMAWRFKRDPHADLPTRR